MIDCIIIHLLNQKWQTSYAIFKGEKGEYTTCWLMLEEWSYDSPPTPNVLLTKDDWDLCLMITFKHQRMMIDQDASSRSITNDDWSLAQVIQSLVIPQGVDDDYHDYEVAHMNNDPSFCS